MDSGSRPGKARPMTQPATVTVPRSGIVIPVKAPVAPCGVTEEHRWGFHVCDRDTGHREDYHRYGLSGRVWPTEGFLAQTGYPYKAAQQREAAAELFRKETHTP